MQSTTIQSVFNNASLGPETDMSHQSTNSRDVFILILYMATALVAMVGNTFICLAIWHKKWLKSTTYILIFSMALSDIMGGFVIPGQWLFCSTWVLDSSWLGQAICGLMKSLQMLSYYVSSLSMMVIAYDRFLLVCRPMSPKTNVRLLVAIPWVMGLLFISCNVFSMRVSEYFSPTKVSSEKETIYQIQFSAFFPGSDHVSRRVPHQCGPCFPQDTLHGPDGNAILHSPGLHGLLLFARDAPDLVP